MIKAIIFDMDGVIIDSEPYYQSELIKCFQHFNIKVTFADLIPLAGGSTNHYDQVVNPLLEKGHVPRDVFDNYCNLNYERNPVPFPKLLFPNVREVLDWITNHNYPIALASSSKEYEIRNVLKSCDIESYFEFIISGENFKESKPNPEIYLACVKKLGLSPQECMAIEDSEYGITAAKKAGLTCIAREDLRFGYNQTKADFIVKDLFEIINILKEEAK